VRQNEGQENGYGRYCNHNMRRALPRTPRDVAVLFSARYLTVLTGGLRLSHVWGNVVGLAEPLPRTVRIWAALHSRLGAGVHSASLYAISQTARTAPGPHDKQARPHSDQEDRVFILGALLIHTLQLQN